MNKLKDLCIVYLSVYVLADTFGDPDKMLYALTAAIIMYIYLWYRENKND